MAAAPDGRTRQESHPTDRSPKAELHERQALDVLRANLVIISGAVWSRESRLAFGRVLRTTASVRTHFTDTLLRWFFSQSLSQTPSKKMLLEYLQPPHSVDDVISPVSVAVTSFPKRGTQDDAAPEQELYCFFVLCQFLADQENFLQLQQVAQAAVDHARAHNRRTLDVLAARCAFYLSLAAEANNQLDSLRPHLLTLHATAVLNHDDVGQETLLNLLLRNYLHYSMYDQAEHFRAQAQRHDGPRSNQQHCRYLYYLGKIRAVQLEYSEAKECLQQAARKAPMVAHGFLTSVHKWLTVIRLLLGEIPERSELAVPGTDGTLRPYLSLATAVRSGDVTAFNTVALSNSDVFLSDQTHNLINRLRYNVLRAGLRRISLAYSRISLQDVAAKLGLLNVMDTEAVVAKTIRDGSISARLDHTHQSLVSCQRVNAYATDEASSAFHVRTAFCMDIHNDAVRAMRFDGGGESTAVDRNDNVDHAEIDAIAAAISEDGEF